MLRYSPNIPLLSVVMQSQAVAIERTEIIDVSDNLYYSGLVPERSASPANGGTYYGTYIPSAGYPEQSIPFAKYAGAPIGDCVRNVFYTDAGGNERAPNPSAGEKLNSFGADFHTGCFGTPPVVVNLAEIGVAPGDTLYLKATGLIDDNAGFGFGPGPVDPRGLPDSDAASDNNIDQYAAIGLFAKSDTTGILTNDQDFKDHVNAAWVSGNVLGLLDNPGFEVVDFNNGEREFSLVDDLGMAQTNTFVDEDGDNRTDQGTGEFAGSVTVPAGATHLILAYNTAKGGFYHHGDPRYFGADNPLITGENGGWPAIDDAKLRHDLIINADGGWATPSLLPDLFPNDGVDVAPGETRAAGVFKITLSDSPITNTPLPPLPEARLSVSRDGLLVNVDGGDSIIPAASIVSYSWDFGDGSERTSGSVSSHAYNQAGDYTITLTVLTNDNQSRSTETRVSVSETNNEGNPLTGGPEEDNLTNPSRASGGGAINSQWAGFLSLSLYMRQKKKKTQM